MPNPTPAGPHASITLSLQIPMAVWVCLCGAAVLLAVSALMFADAYSVDQTARAADRRAANAAAFDRAELSRRDSMYRLELSRRDSLARLRKP